MDRRQAILSMKEILERRRDALRQALAGDLTRLKELRTSFPADQLDVTLNAVQDEVSSQLAEVEGRELVRINHALGLMKKGVYGICEDCENEIPLPRLRALPCATRCIGCQREREYELKKHHVDS